MIHTAPTTSRCISCKATKREAQESTSRHFRGQSSDRFGGMGSVLGDFVAYTCMAWILLSQQLGWSAGTLDHVWEGECGLQQNQACNTVPIDKYNKRCTNN